MRTRFLSSVVLTTILSIACGGQGSSPISPSAVAPSIAASGGATVTGDVRMGATAGVGSAADPMKVQVVGTDIVATVSLAGQFVLNGVPSGQVQLHFFGAGVNATLMVGQVATGETVTISVTVVGTTAVVASEARKVADQAEEQIEGRVESLPPTQIAGTFVVSGRTVTTTPTTVFRMGSATKTFADLEIGQRVHVKGSTAAGVFTATLVDIQNVQTDLPVNLNGIVSGLTGSELAFQFMVDGRTITGDHETVFYGNGGMGRFTDLANGVRVEVKGQQRDAMVYAVRIHVNGKDDDGVVEFEARGTIVSLTGSCPTFNFVLGGKTIITDATTQFKGAGCVGVINGLGVEVEGLLLADGTVRATKVDIDKDQLEFEAKGSVAGLTGACPSLVFTIGGVIVRTNASTQFKGGECSAIAEGDQAEVKGTKQADGTVTATRVDTEKKKDDDDDGDDENGSAFDGSGTMSELSGTCPAISFTLTVKSLTSLGKNIGVDTDAATWFKDVSCAALKNGLEVSVRGTKQASGRVLATKIWK